MRDAPAVAVATPATESDRGDDGPLDQPTLITVTRQDPKDIGQRQVVVRVDAGAPITLMFGDTRTISIAPGRHQLRAHNTLVRKTVPFVIETGEHIEFLITNRASRWGLGLLALVGVAPVYLQIERRARL